MSRADTTGPSRRQFLQAAGLATLGTAMEAPDAARAHSRRAGTPRPAQASRFAVAFEDGAITSLRCADDTVPTQYVAPGSRLGDVVLRYRQGNGAWESLDTGGDTPRRAVSTEAGGMKQRITVAAAPGSAAPEVDIRFTLEEQAIRWTIDVRNPTSQPLEVGDLAIPLPINRNRPTRGEQSPSPPVLKHSLVAGHGSYLVWTRGNSVGPYLMLTPDGRTGLEYWEAQDGYQVFIHSAAAGAVAAERGCNWRQPNTALTLEPGAERSYSFTMRWAEDYDHAREILVEQGLVDAQVVPGMTVPTDLHARIALRTREEIHGVDAEHPAATDLRRVGNTGDAVIYEVAFSRLGENRLTVRFGDERHLHLEFFAAEPLETLIAKRAAFIAAHQHRDPSLWYDGLLAEWAMDTHVMLGPDNYDRIVGWRIYEVTCDDPGLSKPAFLASKNAEFPVQEEVEALDYYIENFVWGGLQRTTEETFSYGIYGIPDWKTNRESDDPGRAGRQHLWRIYDYPHITLMYLSMYRIARNHPYIRTAMTAHQYLMRAYGTALALFTVPWEIERWSAYGTGLMNGLVVQDVVGSLLTEGMHDEAERLLPHWERKVRTFVTDRPDLFRSEYPFDTTGFEETHALAKYALAVADAGGPEEPREVRVGWVDYPPSTRIPLEAAREFMQAQMAANIFCRGWLENAYYLLGSDIRNSDGNSYTLSYMSQMGGWSVLDYGLHHAEDPWPYLRLGYASFLSAWALMNTGTPESDQGYWYPGPENDGGAGGGFEPAPYGETWLDQPHSRGSWYYSCEIDLGFCGGLRCARTVIADDPIFGRFCFGGTWREATGREASGRAGRIEVVPQDGVRRRFHAILTGGRLHMETEVDRFATDRPIAFTEDLAELRFELESGNPAAHLNTVRVAGLPAGSYRVMREDRSGEDVPNADQAIASFDVDEGAAASFDVPVDGTAGSGVVTVRADPAALLLDPSNPEWTRPSPPVWRASFETSKGDFVLELTRDQAPIGADRFYNLVRLGYYDDTRFHRVSEGYIVQFGLHGDPRVNAAWLHRQIPDDPAHGSNVRGTLAFAMSPEPNTRNTQIYINLGDNTRNDVEPFAIFGRVVEGMDVLDRLYAGYGEQSGSGVRQGRQGPIVEGGNEYLDRNFPLLDRIISATLVASGPPGAPGP
ncbi:MAG: DUF5695 domain-containing protein [Gemmatimonadetes bacterium]|nr:DUF5695 domain-containing protein [Gemmatimonadota bacterium]